MRRAKTTLKALAPMPAQDWLRRRRDSYRSVRRAARKVRSPRNDFGGLRRLAPLSDSFGTDRGTPIDRYYIAKFLAGHSAEIRGCVLEFGDDRYTRAFGGDRVVKTDVLHYVPGNPKATIIADLSRADEIRADLFDCIIITQTLQMIYDVRSAVRHLHRILRPGGSVLMTSHGTSKVGRQMGTSPWGEYWRFTEQSARLLFEEHFPPDQVQVASYGNVLAAIAFLHGLAAEELDREELDYHDPRFEVLVGVKASK